MNKRLRRLKSALFAAWFAKNDSRVALIFDSSSNILLKFSFMEGEELCFASSAIHVGNVFKVVFDGSKSPVVPSLSQISVSNAAKMANLFFHGSFHHKLDKRFIPFVGDENVQFSWNQQVLTMKCSIQFIINRFNLQKVKLSADLVLESANSKDARNNFSVFFAKMAFTS